MVRIVLAGALDTKGGEYAYWSQLVARAGLEPILVDVGTRGHAQVLADVDRRAIAERAGLALDQKGPDRAAVLSAMGDGLADFVEELSRDGAGPVGLAGMGGSGAVTLLTPALQRMPLGSPKLLTTTMVDTAATALRGTDTLVVPSIVDISGLNRVSRAVLARSAEMLATLAAHPFTPAHNAPGEFGAQRRTVALTMFGVTTVAADAARTRLEAAGCEVLAFHANGAGGRTMEALIEAGAVDGVLDLTTTELADDLLGGKASAGPSRLEAAARNGTPQVVSVGALDMANFGPLDALPARVGQGRRSYAHGPMDTLVRTTADDCATLGRRLGEKVGGTSAPCVVLLPEGATSALSEPGAAFDDPRADATLRDAVKTALHASAIDVHVLPGHLNTPGFGTAAANTLIRLLNEEPAQ